VSAAKPAASNIACGILGDIFRVANPFFRGVANLAGGLARDIGRAARHVLNGVLNRPEHIRRSLFRLVTGFTGRIACRLSKAFGFVFSTLHDGFS